MDEERAVLRSFLPAGWEELGRSSGALKGLRKDRSAEASLRVLLLHLGWGHSLRETVVRARDTGLADLSDVALLKRLRKSSDWLHGLCVALFRERGLTRARKRARREAGRQGGEVRPATLAYADHVIVFTTFREATFGLARTIAQWNDISKALAEPPRRRRPQRDPYILP